MREVYIALGSNWDSPSDQLHRACQAIQALPHTQLIQRSKLYHTLPLGPSDQPTFLNAVIELETSLSPFELLQRLQAIEQQQGRLRHRHWGERTLDLDILWYGSLSIDEPQLKIPHPEMKKRAFVLYPLAEIAPNFVFEGGKTIAHHLQQVNQSDILKVEDWHDK